MRKWSASVRSAFNRAFPERQIYHRSGGTVRYISVSPWQQVIMASGALAVLVWTIFATGSYIISGNSGGIGGADQRELAKYQRWVQELRAKDALSRSLLEERTEDFEKTTVQFEEHQELLEHLLKSLEGEEELEVSALKGDGAPLLIHASIEEADIRQSREMPRTAQIYAAAGPGAKKRAIQARNLSILDKAEDIAITRTDRARGILNLTSVNVDNIDSGLPMGGPLVEFSAFGANELSDPDTALFRKRAGQVAARIAETRYFEGIVESLPLSEPVGVSARLTSPYGLRVDPFLKRPRWHDGVDIAAFSGAPIVAAGPGKIIFAGRKSGYGKVVYLDHGNGFISRYGHLRSILAKKGDIVSTGDKIGVMGSTGRSTGAHVHFEVRFNGKAYDPVKFLKAGKHVHKD